MHIILFQGGGDELSSGFVVYTYGPLSVVQIMSYDTVMHIFLLASSSFLMPKKCNYKICNCKRLTEINTKLQW